MLERLRASGRKPSLPSNLKEKEKVVEAKEGEGDDDVFDLLIIGGGATGAGVAVDAASRGLKVALVERDDFSSGTSSKSTKLVHGGVRYLQKAVFELDLQQYNLVREALHERKIFLQTAPYLSAMLPIMLPIYKYWQVPYYLAGCKLYDILAGKENMESSYVMSKGKALEAFPMLKGKGLVGAVVYYDGQHNDSRMNVALVMTAVKHGATVANYVEVTELCKDPTTGKLVGAKVRDTLPTSNKKRGNEKEFEVRARGVINATGPFADSILTLDNPTHAPIVQPSSGVHITLPGYYSPRTMGLLDPATSDGRVIFFLPWQGNTIAGTTDSPSKVEREPRASEEDIRWLLEEVRSYLASDIKVRRGDVLSAWSGLRPLVRDPSSAEGKGTAGLVRSHLTHLSPSGLLTIAGGKWTTYRKMAEETVDEAVKVFGLERKVKTKGCVTDNVRLVGSDGWSRNMFIGLIQTYGLETDVARHLSDNYGDRAWTVCSLAEPTGETWPLHGKRLVPQYPFIDAEVTYAIKHEYAQTATDVLARRTRLSFLNTRAALDALPTVIAIMSKELGWTKKEEKRQIRETIRYLVGSMGLQLRGYGGEEKEGKQEEEKRMKEVEWEVVRRAGEVRREREPESGLGVLGYLSGGLVALGSLFTPSFWRSSLSSSSPSSSLSATYSPQQQQNEIRLHGRARFQPSEISALRHAFSEYADSETHRVSSKEIVRIVKGPEMKGYGYGEVTEGDLEYVLEEMRISRENSVQEQEGGVDFEEFIEICGNLKDVGVTPSTVLSKERKRIPVEKSGGGV
ncbi:hypothetical protein EST38_g4501 [Candolleomyces aberdarensis]|uniref:Glycerol-3-phosphate dehydrogenase n=1 Tax=Candolleomyces aberdarensis TaxID=2316362 RepID=A0A4Q2DN04_9AGAR|nr:hypothetical protein EST38_g4501 [Candolleomyces aberdarensis]